MTIRIVGILLSACIGRRVGGLFDLRFVFRLSFARGRFGCRQRRDVGGTVGWIEARPAVQNRFPHYGIEVVVFVFEVFKLVEQDFFLLDIEVLAFFGAHFKEFVPKVEINPLFKAEIVDVEMVAAVKLRHWFAFDLITKFEQTLLIKLPVHSAVYACASALDYAFAQ